MSARDPATPYRAVTATGVSTTTLRAQRQIEVQPSLARRDALFVFGLVLVALALRVPNIGRAYWVDEGISIGISSHHLSQIPGLLREDGSPPLFYYMLHFWLEWFGSAEWVAHLLPLIISLLIVPVAYWAGRQIFGDRRAGLASAALMATNPFLNWYSTETRMYTLVVLLATVALTLTWRAVQYRRWTDAAGATVAFAALLYTHDWAIYLAGTTGLGLLIVAWERKDRQLALWSIAGGLVALGLFAPWLPLFIYQAGNTAAPWAVQPLIGDFFADPASALGGTLGFFVAPVLLFGSWWCWKRLPVATQRSSRLFAILALATTVAGWVAAQVEPSWTVRYLAVIVAPYLLAAGGALAATRRGHGILAVVCGALVVWSAVDAVLPNPNNSYAKSNVAAVAKAITPHLHPGDLVIVTQTEQVPVLYHYLPPGLTYLTPNGPVAQPGVVDWRDIVGRLQRATPCTDVSPAIAALPVGALIVEVNPVRTLGANGSAWSRAVNGQVIKVDRYISDDRSLSYAGIYSPALHPKPFSPVDAVVYRKVAAQPACA